MTGSDNLLYCNFVTYKGAEMVLEHQLQCAFSADMEWRFAKKNWKICRVCGSDYTNTVLYREN